MPAGNGAKGAVLFHKREQPPFKSPKRKVLTLRDWGLKRYTACGIGSLRGSIASLAAIGAAIRLASAPIIRCRSADLVLVQPNHRLPIVRILRRAPAMPPWQAMASLYKSEVVGNCVRVTNRRQSDSENRSRPNRIEELNAATPRAGISIPEASRSFKPETANLNAFLLGFQRGYSLSRKRISPLSRTPARPQGICKHIMLAITPNTGYNISLFCLPHSRREERNGSYG